jgi:hypothetical protein
MQDMVPSRSSPENENLVSGFESEAMDFKLSHYALTRIETPDRAARVTRRGRQALFN